MPVPGPRDSRGILDAAGMRTVTTLTRHPPGEALDGVVDWFWAVTWDLPPGEVRVQRLLSMPASHLSVGTLDRAGRVLVPAGARVYGVVKHVDSRRLVGQGWTVAAKSSGGVGALTGRPACTLTGLELPLDVVLGRCDVAGRVESAGGERDRVQALRLILEATLATRPSALVAQAREASAICDVVEHDRSVLRVEQLAACAGVGVRTLQRMFSRHVGVSPKWVIRRWRIIEAADRAGAGEDLSWPDLAADLGYADQSHLVRDFKAHLGTTPSTFAAGGRSD